MISLLESVVDPTLNTYSDDVFQDPEARFPKLKDELRERILNDVRKINDKVKVLDAFIKGSILTKQYTPRSDIDVFVRVKSDKEEEELRELLYSIWLEIDDKRMIGIPHPLQYYITTLEYDLNNTEAAYSLKDNEWIKKSPSKRIDAKKYMKDFKKYVDQFANFSEEVRRDMIDLDIIFEIPKKQLKDLDKMVERRLNRLEKSLNDYVELYTMLSGFRDKAFSDDMTPKEIKKYGSKVRLPGNVVFKMIERYHYVDLAKKIRKIIGKDGELSKEEYKDLNKLLKTNPINPSVSFGEVYSESDLVDDLGQKAGRPQARHQSPKYGAGKTTKMAQMHKKSPLKLDNLLKKSKQNNSRVIKVKQGSPEAHALARKYRIEYPIGKKQVAGNEHDEGITIIFESERPKRFKKGSCMYKAEISTKKLLDRGVNDFKIIEGYVRFDNTPYDSDDQYEHTWLNIKGKIYDPTLEQFKDTGDIQSVEYLPKTEFSPEEYINHCEKYPLDDEQKELLEQKVERVNKALNK